MHPEERLPAEPPGPPVPTKPAERAEPAEPAPASDGARILTKLLVKPLEDRVIDALRTVFDPEIPVNIYDLGLVYGVDVDAEARTVRVRMTLTSPACPVAGSLPGEVQFRLLELDGIDAAEVELVWDPPWTKDMLTEEARLQLGLP